MKATNKTSAGHQTQVQRISAELEAQIVRGELMPGQKLEEVAIAASLSVSRTPVREALRFLQAAGLVELAPRIGAVVARPTVGDIVDLFELVGELEAVAARLACERMTDIALEKIRAAYETLSATGGDREIYLSANDAFHRAIHEAADNRALLGQIEQINKRIAPYRRYITFRPERDLETEREHEAIATALFAKDGPAAAAAMADHLRVMAEDSLALARSLRL